MKKEISFIIIFIILILVVIFIYFKRNNNEKNSNPFIEYSFYKVNNLNRYEKYYKNNNFSVKDVILRVNMNLDYSFYTNTKEIKEFNNLMLVNKYNHVSKEFKPNLVNVPSYAKKGMFLTKECLDAYLKMASDIKKSNLNIRIISSYRTYEYQEGLYTNYVKKDGVVNADTYSARPGFSEHHTGLAIDIDNISLSYNNFSNTKEFLWMQKNASKYGFILRYPKGKEDITGYMYEPWHYRYVGVDVATYIKDHNLTFEEYYYEFLDK